VAEGMTADSEYEDDFVTAEPSSSAETGREIGAQMQASNSHANADA